MLYKQSLSLKALIYLIPTYLKANIIKKFSDYVKDHQKFT